MSLEHHRLFGIKEILDTILARSIEGLAPRDPDRFATLQACAVVSKEWSQSALPLLWQEINIPQLYNLVAIIGAFRKDGIWVSTDKASQTPAKLTTISIICRC